MRRAKTSLICQTFSQILNVHPLPVTALSLKSKLTPVANAFDIMPNSRRTFCAGTNKDEKEETQLPEVPHPTALQLRRRFVQSAVPFVAFGIVDNTVLIYAGDAIDNTFGVRFGLPTLAAAATGQIFSDSCGAAFGGTIEAAALKLGLPTPNITEEQNKLGIVRRVDTAGSVVGVITGCLIGMLNLLVIDLGAAEREKRAKELETIMNTVMDDGRELCSCERATLWIVDEEAKELWTSIAHGVQGILRLPMDSESVAVKVAKEGKMVNIADVSKDSRSKQSHRFFDQDKVGDFVTRNMLVSPVLDPDGKVVAVIQFLNKVSEKDKSISSVFDSNDEKMLKMLTQHTALFMQQLS